MTHIIKWRDDSGPTAEVDLDLPPSVKRLVLEDARGREHHFGAGLWSRGQFTYVGTYAAGRRVVLESWDDVIGPLREDCVLVDDPVGPLLSPLTTHALGAMTDALGTMNGFAFPREKTVAVTTLRALAHEAQEPIPPDEIALWAATHSWSLIDAEMLGEIAEGVLAGREFRGEDGRSIPDDPTVARKLVARWRAALAGTSQTA